MRRAVAVVWMLVVAFVLAALVHTRDPGVVGLEGLTAPRVLPSLALLTALLAGLEFPSLVAYLRGGVPALATAVAITALLLGLGLAAAGSETATRSEFVTIALAGAGVAAAGLVIAVVPASRGFRPVR